MKKIILYSAAIAALFACNKIEEEVIPVNSEGKQIITAYASIPFTKLAYEENTVGGGGGLSSTWETGDTFKAIQKTGGDVKVVTFTLYDGDGTSSGKFQTETEGVTAETKWTAVLGSHSTISGEEEIQCSYKGQNGKLASLDDYNYVVSSGTGTAPTFSFNPGTAKSYIMRIKLPAGIKCIEYTPSAYWKVSTSEVKRQYYSFTNPQNGDASNSVYTYAAFEAANTSTIELDAASASGDIIYLAVPAINYDYTSGGTVFNAKQYCNIYNGVIVTLMNDVSDEATLSCGAVLGSDVSTKGGQIGTFDMSGKTLLHRPKPADAIRFQTASNSFSDSGRSFNSKTDTYWSPFNVGASSEAEVGNYYSWGEIEPKATYSEATYSRWHDPDGDAKNVLDAISFKFTPWDGASSLYSIAGSRYDAARVQWGVAWRMCSVLELMALSKHTRAKVTTPGTGTKVTVSGGSDYIFIPQSNIMINSTLSRYPGKIVDWSTFWTSDNVNRIDVSGNPPIIQPFMQGDNGGIDYWNNKNYVRFWWGEPVRPVLASSTIEQAS